MFATGLPVLAAGQGDWAPDIVAGAAAFAVPVPAGPLPATGGAAPYAGQNYSAAEEMLIKEFGVAGITLNVPEEEVVRQASEHGGKFCFDRAFRSMLKSFFEDHSDPASPLSLVLAGMGASVKSPTVAELKSARGKLLQLLNMPGSALLLVREDGYAQPARGESVVKNWVIRLRMGYSPGSFWAIGDRSGKKSVYNYGVTAR